MPAHGSDQQLSIPRHSNLLEAFADISFAPPGGRSLQGIVSCLQGFPVQWEATRQPFTAMSTAEAELIGYCEAMTMLSSLEALMMAVTGDDQDSAFEKVILGDNQLALQLISRPDGPWRTRHLRLRSNVLKEKLHMLGDHWKIRYVKGSDLVTDYLTKPITQGSSWCKFWEFLGMVGPTRLDPLAHSGTTKEEKTDSTKVAALSSVSRACALLAAAKLLKDQMNHFDDAAASAVMLGALLALICGLKAVSAAGLTTCFEPGSGAGSF